MLRSELASHFPALLIASGGSCSRFARARSRCGLQNFLFTSFRALCRHPRDRQTRGRLLKPGPAGHGLLFPQDLGAIPTELSQFSPNGPRGPKRQIFVPQRANLIIAFILGQKLRYRVRSQERGRLWGGGRVVTGKGQTVVLGPKTSHCLTVFVRPSAWITHRGPHVGFSYSLVCVTF